ncbi:unnamed protein product [Nezara viridula]|uniref:Uncharacterized protein n=1 Tax=Nezara viridula TaxID=85310 RepID=A0A9P0HCD9_NEZVI|nr:unnamed protein product [Nezara viridula]
MHVTFSGSLGISCCSFMSSTCAARD